MVHTIVIKKPIDAEETQNQKCAKIKTNKNASARATCPRTLFFGEIVAGVRKHLGPRQTAIITSCYLSRA